MTQQVYWIFGSLGTLLLFATLIGQFIRRKYGNSDVISNLNLRINAWWVMILILGVAFFLGQYGVTILFFLISFYALREFLTLISTKSSDYSAMVAAFYIALPVQYILIALDWYGLYSIFIPVYLFLLMPILASFGGDTTRFLERTAKIQWAVMIAVYCLSYVPATLSLYIPNYEGDNLLLIAWFIFVVQISDVLQYIFGKLLGKRKIAPLLSPSKTWEGLIGGVIAASCIGALMFGITPFNLWQAGAIALLICLLGFAGGLVMSAIKRDHQVKDWGNMIGGHGGMLDRMDSICFAAPIFFHVVRYWWT